MYKHGLIPITPGLIQMHYRTNKIQVVSVGNWEILRPIEVWDGARTRYTRRGGNSLIDRVSTGRLGAVQL